MQVTRRSTILWAFVLLAIVVLAGVLRSASARSPAYYEIAEAHEEQGHLELARAAWLSAKARIVDLSTKGEPGRRAYYEYRIGMSYEQEGQYELAAAHVRNALMTPAAEINEYLCRNGATEVQKDLDDLVSRAANLHLDAARPVVREPG